MRKSLFLGLALSAGVAVGAVFAGETKEVPLTAAELAKEFNLEHHRWRITFDEPVVAKMWITDTDDEARPERVSAATSGPGTSITYGVTITHPAPAHERDKPRKIEISVEGQNDGMTSMALVNDYRVVDSGQTGFDNVRAPAALDRDYVLYKWDQKLERKNGSPTRVIEVKIRFSKTEKGLASR